jgi:hypothetical protein
MSADDNAATRHAVKTFLYNRLEQTTNDGNSRKGILGA